MGLEKPCGMKAAITAAPDYRNTIKSSSPALSRMRDYAGYAVKASSTPKELNQFASACATLPKCWEGRRVAVPILN